MRFRPAHVIFTFLLVASRLQGVQASDPTQMIKGQVLQDGGIYPPGLTVLVRDLTNHGMATEATVMADGSFDLPALEPGKYEVTITNQRGEPLHREFLDIGPNPRPLMLRLPVLEQPAPSAPGTISAKRLQHRIPSKAAKEYRASLKASEAGDARKCMEHLQKAIEIDPDYMEAHNNLGVRYMALEQYEKAVAQFHKTVELDPTTVKGQLNLSLALSLLQRYPEAEAAARQAVQLEPQFIPARYALGQILTAQDKNTPEAVDDLRMSIRQYPGARLSLARVLVRRGAINEAVAQLQEYLRSENPDKREQAQAWLAQLTR